LPKNETGSFSVWEKLIEQKTKNDQDNDH